MNEIEPELLFAIIGEQAVRLRLADAELTRLTRRIAELEFAAEPEPPARSVDANPTT